MTSIAQPIGSQARISDTAAQDKVYNVHGEFKHQLGFAVSSKYLKQLKKQTQEINWPTKRSSEKVRVIPKIMKYERKKSCATRLAD